MLVGSISQSIVHVLSRLARDQNGVGKSLAQAHEPMPSPLGVAKPAERRRDVDQHSTVH